jgi:hypothetical protein
MSIAVDNTHINTQAFIKAKNAFSNYEGSSTDALATAIKEWENCRPRDEYIRTHTSADATLVILKTINSNLNSLMEIKQNIISLNDKETIERFKSELVGIIGKLVSERDRWR